MNARWSEMWSFLDWYGNCKVNVLPSGLWLRVATHSMATANKITMNLYDHGEAGIAHKFWETSPFTNRLS
jgi:hypothetical protein